MREHHCGGVALLNKTPAVLKWSWNSLAFSALPTVFIYFHCKRVCQVHRLGVCPKKAKSGCTFAERASARQQKWQEGLSGRSAANIAHCLGWRWVSGSGVSGVTKWRDGLDREHIPGAQCSCLCSKLVSRALLFCQNVPLAAEPLARRQQRPASPALSALGRLAAAAQNQLLCAARALCNLDSSKKH